MTRAAEIARALGGAQRAGAGWLAFCPAHENRRTPALSLRVAADGRLLAWCFAGCRFTEIIGALSQRGLVGNGHRFSGTIPEAGPFAAIDDATNSRRRINLALRIWRRTMPIAGTPADTYLRRRAIRACLPSSLRFHPALRHPRGILAPAMVALIERGREAIGIHRTWLATDGSGKAPLDPARAMLGLARGGAVRLSNGPGALVVSEGIETGLSLAEAIGDRSSVWAALSSSGVASLRLPDPALPELVIAPDGDSAGHRASTRLAERAAGLGWRVRVMDAPDGRDWNDVAMEACHG